MMTEQDQGVTASSGGHSGGPTDPSPSVSAVPAPAVNADALVDRIALSLAIERDCDPKQAKAYRLEAQAIVADLWQPVDTAPLDGTRIIAWWKHLGEPVVAWIAQGGQRHGSWTFSGLPSVKHTPVNPPAAWMPLPGPPNA